MSGTFSKIYIQVVFAVKGRQSLISPQWENELYQYIGGIIKGKDQIPIAINGMPDHIHIFFAMKPSCCLSDLVREIKKSSNEFIKAKGFTRYNFEWQGGYGAFSYAQSESHAVAAYVNNQKQHHQTTEFLQEYKTLLKESEIAFEEKYLFDSVK